MSVLIKGMKMPTSCSVCWALDDYGDYPRCRITEEQRGYNFPVRDKRMDNCPLVPVPPHGRLIDADSVLDGLAHNLRIRSLDYLTVEEKKIVSWFRNAPTIIEAENLFFESLKRGLKQAINGDVREQTISDAEEVSK